MTRSAAGGRRPRSQVSRNRYRLRRVAVVGAFGLLVFGGFRVAQTLTGDDGTASGVEPEATVAAASTTVAPGAAGATTPVVLTPTTAAPADDDGPPSAADPARILIVGDSDAGTFGPYLEQLLDENDDVGSMVDVTLDYVVSSGLSRPDFHDWPAHLEQALAEVDPDIVIVTFGGNDAQGLSSPCPNGQGTCSPSWVVGGPVDNEDEWTAEYEQRVDTVVDMMLEGGRQVIWVGIPNAQSEQMTAGLKVQDQAVRAALDGRENVSFIDTWDMFDGGNGGYAEYVPDPRDGQAKPIRAGDGFHLNQTGAEILALKIFDQVETVLTSMGAEW